MLQFQTAEYAGSLNMKSVALVQFVPVEDETVMEILSVQMTTNRVTVHIVAIGWT